MNWLSAFTLTCSLLVLQSVPIAYGQNLAREASPGVWQIEDSSWRFQIGKARGGQLDSIINKSNNRQLLAGNGYYYLAGIGADSYAGNFYQSFDSSSDLAVYENTRTRCIIEVAGNLRRPPEGGSTLLGVRYVRRYTYTRDSNQLVVNHNLRFDRSIVVNYLSATMDMFGTDWNYSWSPSIFYIGGTYNTFVRRTGGNLSGPIDRPPGYQGNVGRTYRVGDGSLSGNQATIRSRSSAGSITRRFDSGFGNVRSLTYWTNIPGINSNTLEAHFLNGNTRTIAAGTVLRATETLQLAR